MNGASNTIHASCVSIGGRGVLLSGTSGSGKSDLALRLIDRGARLVSDDYTQLVRIGDSLIASAPSNIAGFIEVRWVGIVALEALAQAAIALLVELDGVPERLPEIATWDIAGVAVPRVVLSPLEASAPIKVELALERLGISGAAR